MRTSWFRSSRHRADRLNLLTAVVAIFAVGGLTPPQASASGDIVVVVGHGGDDVYAKQFASWSQQLHDALASHAESVTLIGPAAEVEEEQSDRARLLETLQSLSGGDNPLILFLIGHGTATQSSAKFNLVGPDVTAAELDAALDEIDRPLVVFNCSSASGPFIEALSSPRRTIVTATKNANEYSFSRFGGAVARALAQGGADIDHDTEVSVLEVFLAAAAGVEAFYQQEGRIASEHALLDDNGDRRGTPPGFFQAGRLVRSSKDGVPPDGERALRQILIPSPDPLPFTDAELERRNQLEAEIDSIRQQKSDLAASDYYAQLRDAFKKLARLYATAEERKEKPKKQAD